MDFTLIALFNVLMINVLAEKSICKLLEKRSATSSSVSGLPKFTHPMRNATVLEGQEVTLTCTVSSLHGYKLAWVHEDTQSILSIGRQLYTHSKRLSLAVDHKTTAITIAPVLASDRGWYMCQVNTDPMTSAHSYLQVLVPPSMREWSGPEVEAREGSQVQLICLARAHPPSKVTWRRTDALPVFNDGKKIWVVEGVTLDFPLIRRDQSATYTCHVDNLVTPAMSKDTHLIVTYPPMIWLKNELIGAELGTDASISCESDGNPTPRHYWHQNGTKISNSQKFRLWDRPMDERWQVLLTIRNVEASDFGRYSCVASNGIGQAEGTIRLYEIKEQRLVAMIIPSTIKPQATVSTEGVTMKSSTTAAPTSVDVRNKIKKSKFNFSNRNLKNRTASFFDFVFNSCSTMTNINSSAILILFVTAFFR